MDASQQMDSTQVYMVRSAKGNDMLCVDSFLYHYEDRGQNTYRWICNKRKDKMLPCRSRIITTLTNGDDESKHFVQKVVGEHTHGKCTAEEIFKVYERKRIANLAGLPCTLENKAQKRVQKRIDEFQGSHSQSKKMRLVKTEDSDGDQELDEPDSDVFGDEEVVKQESSTQRESRHRKTAKHRFKGTANKLYELKTKAGRQMLCLDGYFYCLDGKSLKSEIYRWQCVRKRDINCSTRIYTEYESNGRHKLKQTRREEHSHEPYTQMKLIKLLEKNNMQVINDDEADFENKNTSGSSSAKSLPPKRQKLILKAPVTDSEEDFGDNVIEEIEKNVSNTSQKSKRGRPRIRSSTPAAKKVKPKWQYCSYTLSDDPLSVIKIEGETKEVDNTKFTFLPSAKGNKVLCLNNYLYHFDSNGPKDRSYWTCVLRRDKVSPCKARITMVSTDAGPVIAKNTGSHLHPSNSLDIKKRLYKGVVAFKANETELKPSEIIKSSIDEFGDDFKEMVAKSKESIERRILRLRTKTRQKAFDNFNDCESDSSLSSAFECDDDHFNSNLPNKLEEMCEPEIPVAQNNEPVEDADEKDFLNSVIETIWEVKQPFEQENETAMDEEYLDTNTYDRNYNSSDEDVLGNNADAIEDEGLKIVIKSGLGRKPNENNDDLDMDMDITKVSKLRSAKGGELLCVDGYIYHMKSTQNIRTYWACIKCRDREKPCKSRVATVPVKNGHLRIFKVTNRHTHPVNEVDIKRRIYNELTRGENPIDVSLKPSQILDKSLFELSSEYADLVANSWGAAERCLLRNRTKLSVEGGSSVMKLYAVSDGPPSLAVRMTLKALKIPFELINVDYAASEHLSESYAKLNPQKEIPVLDDDGFYLSESVAIMQYLCDKYSPQSTLYPKDATQRAIVNHRLCFNMGFYYASISMHSMAPIFFDYKRTDMSLKKVKNALDVFETYLKRGGTRYAAGDHITIADFALVAATLCLEAIAFDLSPYPLVKDWYENFKQEQPDLWEISNGGMQEIIHFEKNPPDLSQMNHPFHPTRKAN